MSNIPDIRYHDQGALAEAIATDAHRGQFRNDGVTPYIEHPKRVASMLATRGSTLVAIAWLHDVLEDTAITAQDLLQQGIRQDIIDSVIRLTKDPSLTYEQNIDRICGDPNAELVKIADHLDNLSDSPSRKQVARYTNSLKKLLNLSPCAS